MANRQDERRRIGGDKASGIKTGGSISIVGGESPSAGKKTARGEMTAERRPGYWRTVVADLVLLLLLAALCVGVIFGYRALKDIYDPEGEPCRMEFLIRVTDVDEQTVNTFLYDEDGNNLFENSEIYHTDRVDGDCLGIVKDVKVEPGSDPDKATFTLYLTVTSDAEYREGEGYFVEDTQLLAGVTDQYRVHGMSFEGLVTSLHPSEAA